MRVLHLYAGNLFGGIERMLLAMSRARNTCDVVAPHFALCFEGQVADELRQSEAPLTILGSARMSRPWTVAAARRRLRDLLDAEKFDVAITHSFWPHGLLGPVVRSAGLPLVVWLHDVPSGGGWLEHWAARTPPDLVLANSRYTAAAAPKVFAGIRCVVQHPIMEPPAALDRAAARRVIRRPLNTRDDALVIVQTSRLQPGKGHAVLLEALGRLRDRALWHCWIAGSPQRAAENEYLMQLQEQADRLEIGLRVQLLGQRDDVPQVLAAADIFCQPHTAPEGFGMALVEALQAGLPVVTSDLGAASEIVDSSCGRLIHPDDGESLAAQLDVLLNDPQLRTRLSQAGPARVAERFDPQVALPALYRHLQTVVRSSVSV